MRYVLLAWPHDFTLNDAHILLQFLHRGRGHWYAWHQGVCWLPNEAQASQLQMSVAELSAGPWAAPHRCSVPVPTGECPSWQRQSLALQEGPPGHAESPAAAVRLHAPFNQPCGQGRCKTWPLTTQ